jgi:hypothetical protein
MKSVSDRLSSSRVPGLLLLCLALAALGTFPQAGSAGTYPVVQCDYQNAIAASPFQWTSAGSPALIQQTGSGCAEIGLALRSSNTGFAQTYPHGAIGEYFAKAPAGTSFVEFEAAFGTKETCCIPGMALRVEAAQHEEGSGAVSTLLAAPLGNATWGPPAPGQGPVLVSWSGAASGFAAKRIAYGIECTAEGGCPQDPTGDMRIRARSFRFTMEDATAPSIEGADGSLLSPGWIRGPKTLSFSATDEGGGLTGLGADVGDALSVESVSTCTRTFEIYAALVPCPLSRDVSWTIETAELPDGPTQVTVMATDVGGGSTATNYTVLLDNTPPSPPESLKHDGSSAWKRDGAFAVSWTNPEDAGSPITVAHYVLCAANGSSPCITGEAPADESSIALKLAEPGEYVLKLSLADTAGNWQASSQSAPLNLRFDNVAPTGAFDPQDPADPRKIVVSFEDPLSGIADGYVEFRRVGADAFSRLPTTRDGGRLVGRLDDLAMADGRYEFRAIATDVAGNEAVIARRSGGEAMVLDLPVRQSTSISVKRAWVAKRCKAAKRTTIRRRTAKRSCPRRAGSVLSYGKTLASSGALTTSAGPVAGAELIVEAQPRSGGPFTVLGKVTTNAQGGFRFVIPRGPSRTVRYRYAGTDTHRPAASDLTTKVAAAARLRVDRVRVPNGRPVRFTGRLLGTPIPKTGKIVALQAKVGRKWRTFATPRANRRGVFEHRYRFTATTGLRRYVFRAVVAREGAYPYERGVSRPVRVTVHGG